jgi:hypothetical protein
VTVEQNHDCRQCGAKPGERHREWDDLARCRSTGRQLIQCEGELHEYHGVQYGEHEGPCGPDVWDGEYPGVKACRRFGFYTVIDGEETEDLNRLNSTSEVVWDRFDENFVPADWVRA